MAEREGNSLKTMKVSYKYTPNKEGLDSAHKFLADHYRKNEKKIIKEVKRLEAQEKLKPNKK